ncbi:AAA family ATPase [bacterium]|nr:AAA family ATPase [bacterium]
MLLRLLAHDPKERYGDAHTVIEELCEAIDQPLPPETQAIRESYLKASRFVGRETEVQTLKSALERARTNSGSAWLIGGESGVGKSRFLEEIRISALVGGFSVLQGQATTEAGTPYELWREPLRKLTLRTTLSEIEASVLKVLIPDIEDLLGDAIAAPPEADEQSSQARLMSIIVSMFRQQKQPMLLLFEDLHWVKDGIGLLAHVTNSSRICRSWWWQPSAMMRRGICRVRCRRWNCCRSNASISTASRSLPRTFWDRMGSRNM